MVFSEMNRCSKHGIHEHSANSQIHVQLFHRIDRLSSIDFPDHGEDGLQKNGMCVGDVWRWCFHVASVSFWLINWRTGSVCKGLLPSFTVLGNGFLRNLFPFVVPDFSLRIVGVFWIFFLFSFLMRRVSRCFSINPPRYTSFSRTSEVDAASNEFGSILVLLSKFPDAIGIPGLLDAIGLDAVEELVAMEEDRFIAASRNLDTTIYFSFCLLYPLRHCGAQLVKLKFLVRQVELKFHPSRVKFPLVKMSASWYVVSM